MVLIFAKVGGNLIALDLPVGSMLVGVGRADWWKNYEVKATPTFADLNKYRKEDIDSIAQSLDVSILEPKVKGGMKVKPKSAVINGIINKWPTFVGNNDEEEWGVEGVDWFYEEEEQSEGGGAVVAVETSIGYAFMFLIVGCVSMCFSIGYAFIFLI